MDKMRAIYYEKVEDFKLRDDIDIPVPEANQVLVKIACCGICKTDVHQHSGNFLVDFPFIPGHEMSGTIAKVGSAVTNVKVGDRVTVDDTSQDFTCYYCQNDMPLFCENFESMGANKPGGFAEYLVADFDKVFKLADHVSFEEGSFCEPTACAVHGMDVINPNPGESVLMFGAGPTGIVLAQLLNRSNAISVTVAAPTKSKLDLLNELGIKETYQISRDDAASNREMIMKNHPHGFDIVVDATGSAKVAEDAVQYLKKNGRLVLYAVYSPDATMTVKPADFMEKQIKITGSFAQYHCFPRAVEYINNGTVKVDKLISHVMPLEDFGKGLELAEKGGEGVLKILVKP